MKSDRSSCGDTTSSDRRTSKAELEHEERACNSDCDSRLMSICFKPSAVIPPRPREHNGGGRGLTASMLAIFRGGVTFGNTEWWRKRVSSDEDDNTKSGSVGKSNKNEHDKSKMGYSLYM